ncbi:hypothetical protein MiHa_04609 [Microcystis aeruginosa NIES-2522]|nr:hypothetical protein MiHa_04609 [Microcystis aeruginosa NIES-2522]
MIAGIEVIVGTVTTVQFVITTATNNDIIAGIASDIIIPPIAIDLDIVTDESSIREVEVIGTPITDNGDFSCYSCPVDGFNATIGAKGKNPQVHVSCTQSHNFIHPRGAGIAIDVVALETRPASG